MDFDLILPTQNAVRSDYQGLDQNTGLGWVVVC